MPILPSRFPVAVIVQRTPLASRWASERWEPIAVEPDSEARDAHSHERIGDDSGLERWRFVGYTVELERSEGEGYFLNITSETPKVFVMWRPKAETAIPPIEPELVTVSYNEAGRLLDGGEQVDAMPMLPEILAWMTPFVREHYKPEPKRKVARNDPFADDRQQRKRSR